MPVPHVIKEVAPGVHWTLLDWPSVEIIPSLLHADAPHVLCWGVHVGHNRWEEFLLPTTDPRETEAVLARALDLDFVISTGRFLELLPRIGPSIRGVQLLGRPQDHLDMRRIKGTELWRLLSEVGWHVWFDVPGNDFGKVASPHRHVVEAAIAKTLAGRARLQMRRVPREVDDAFFESRRSSSVPFVINDSVAVIAGPHMGRQGAVISIEAVAPELCLRVELDDGSDVPLLASCVRLVEDAG